MIDTSKMIPGDVILTYGEWRLWPPKYWVLQIFYNAVHAYQKKKWGAHSDYKPTHARVYLMPDFFEVTYPKARWGTIDEITGHYKVCRYTGRELSWSAMMDEAMQLNGSPYDMGDNADFAVSGLLGMFTRNIRLFGDRLKKYVVCSTGAARILTAGGAQLGDTSAYDPASFANQPQLFEVIQEGNA